MKAIQFQFNSSDHSYVEIPKPIPSGDEVLVKVHYSALDTAHDAIIQRDMTSSFIHKCNKKQPLYLGYHFSGTIEAIGSRNFAGGDNDGLHFKVGNEVYGFLQYEPNQTQGAFAEYITVKKDSIALKPSTVSHAVAAASTTESLTALQAIRDHGGLAKDNNNSTTKKRILIVGAGGGVGSAAVQIAKALDNTSQVTAVCSTKDVDQVKAWGADIVIDRSGEPDYLKRLLNEKQQSFDIVLDAPNALSSSATGLLHPNSNDDDGVATLINTIPSLSMLWSMIKTFFTKQKKVAFVEAHSTKSDLELLGKWLENGDVKIPIDSIYKIATMKDAMAKQQSKKKKGRVVIQVENGWD